ncbi:MAG: cobalamin-dependent protein, partial [Deltaproteobacteria bacterium]|nr:cobalamin-dependent protein [Deltaproteobacteria bacterium]
MRVLLVSSYTMEYTTRVDHAPPLALLCIAAILREAGHHPRILDLDSLNPTEGDQREAFYISAILEEIKSLDPGMVGFNCLLSAHFSFTRRAAVAIKAQFPTLPVVLGGIHPTLFAREIIQNCQEIDAIVIGEGERQAVALATAFAENRREAIYQIEALAYRDRNGQASVNPRREFIHDLDSLPLPAWDLIRLEDYYIDHPTWYNPRGLDIKMSVPIMTSRSCPYDCNFCSSHYLMGRGLRLRSPKLVVDEMEMIYQRNGINYFGFVDDNL